ncbi:hypothetical protein [Schleiferilactobacillus harbinensis]|uniref:YozE SAM-like domain-containing protein n=1 Tax=Schleiferilactobacillus harbinensis TaxID=304207 RepID=A0ABU7T3L9_9LACO
MSDNTFQESGKKKWFRYLSDLPSGDSSMEKVLSDFSVGNIRDEELYSWISAHFTEALEILQQVMVR